MAHIALLRDDMFRNDPIWFGSTNVASSYLTGNLDEVRIWNTERSSSTISTYWNQEVTSTTSGLLGLWRFNATTTDLISGNATSGQSGSPTFASSTPFGHFVEGYSSVSGTQMKVAASAPFSYSTSSDPAINTWNLERNITITTSTATSTANLLLTDANNTNIGASAEYCNVSPGVYVCHFTTSTKDTIFFNVPMMPTDPTQKQAAATHELGHSLGLDHSYFGNVMYPVGGLSQTTLGSQDQSDYHFLWGY